MTWLALIISSQTLLVNLPKLKAIPENWRLEDNCLHVLGLLNVFRVELDSANVV